jgi:hypothetical protein
LVGVARFFANIEGLFWIIAFQNNPFPARKKGSASIFLPLDS